MLFDTGIKIEDHPSFKSRQLGKNLLVLQESDSYEDEDGHGTLCAGIACGDEIGNSIPIKCRGVAPEATLLIWKAYKEANDDIDTESLATELEKMADVCMDGYPDVVVISCGTLSNNEQIYDAIKDLNNKHIIVVCSVGNYGANEPKITYPAGYDETIAVGAHGRDGHECRFSSVERPGNYIFLALGENVVGPDLKKSLTRRTGTSFAAPAVGGLICLLLQAFRETCEKSNEELLYYKIKSNHVMKQILRKLSDDKGAMHNPR